MPSQCKKKLWRYASKNCGVIRDDTMNPVTSNDSYNCRNNTDDSYGEEEFLQTKRGRSRSPTHPSVLATTSVMTTFANSASNLIRKCCCGVNIFNNTSSSNNNNNSSSSSNIAKLNDIANSQLCSNNAIASVIATPLPRPRPPPTTPSQQPPLMPPLFSMPTTTSSTTPTPTTPPQPPKATYRQCFDALIKPMKQQQVSALCLAVKSRVERCAIQPAECQRTGNCILIPRTRILGEEPHVIAYRLFLDLRINSYQLKRLPHCLSEHDPVYVCCNPLHWARILETDIAPPPYRRAAYESKDISFGESFQGEENSITRSIENSTLSSQGMLPNLRVRIPESLTTDGEGRRSDSTSWCKVAYWELRHRVGDIHAAKKPSVNICLNSAYCNKEVSEEVSLHNLASTKRTPSPCEVENTRQKIGLGIALSDESDGVWLFNRSMEPIFVHSPTLCASWFQVCKVMPGDCLLAFDYQRARELKDPSQLPGAQAGPVDKYSMRISFVKGYGQTYKRQDLTQCPCWLEVHFTNVGR